MYCFIQTLSNSGLQSFFIYFFSFLFFTENLPKRQRIQNHEHVGRFQRAASLLLVTDEHPSGGNRSRVSLGNLSDSRQLRFTSLALKSDPRCSRRPADHELHQNTRRARKSVIRGPRRIQVYCFNVAATRAASPDSEGRLLTDSSGNC